MEGEPNGDAARPTAFLSYARADQERAAKLARALEVAGVDLWWDTMIEGGAAFAKSIEAALENSNAVIVVWSAASVGSDWVLDEAAKGRDLRKLVPVTFDGIEAPLGFRQYQAIDLSHWRGDPRAPAIVSIIVRAIRVATGQAVRQPPVSRQRSHPLASRRGILIAAGGATIAGAAGIFAWRQGVFGGTRGSRNSVAVLPFKNVGGDQDQAYFSDGLSEELRATLARNQKLQVIAQASSATFRDSNDDAITIASKLGVAYLLEGSVRRSGEILRITSDLVDGRTGFSRWSETFDRVMQDIFAVQIEIANAVASKIDAKVGSDDGSNAGTRPAGGDTRRDDKPCGL